MSSMRKLVRSMDIVPGEQVVVGEDGVELTEEQKAEEAEILRNPYDVLDMVLARHARELAMIDDSGEEELSDEEPGVSDESRSPSPQLDQAINELALVNQQEDRDEDPDHLENEEVQQAPRADSVHSEQHMDEEVETDVETCVRSCTPSTTNGMDSDSDEKEPELEPLKDIELDEKDDSFESHGADSNAPGNADDGEADMGAQQDAPEPTSEKQQAPEESKNEPEDTDTGSSRSSSQQDHAADVFDPEEPGPSADADICATTDQMIEDSLIKLNEEEAKYFVNELNKKSGIHRRFCRKVAKLDPENFKELVKRSGEQFRQSSDFYQSFLDEILEGIRKEHTDVPEAKSSQRHVEDLEMEPTAEDDEHQEPEEQERQEEQEEQEEQERQEEPQPAPKPKRTRRCVDATIANPDLTFHFDREVKNVVQGFRKAKFDVVYNLPGEDEVEEKKRGGRRRKEQKTFNDRRRSKGGRFAKSTRGQRNGVKMDLQDLDEAADVEELDLGAPESDVLDIGALDAGALDIEAADFASGPAPGPSTSVADAEAGSGDAGEPEAIDTRTPDIGVLDIEAADSGDPTGPSTSGPPSSSFPSLKHKGCDAKLSAGVLMGRLEVENGPRKRAHVDYAPEADAEPPKAKRGRRPNLKKKDKSGGKRKKKVADPPFYCQVRGTSRRLPQLPIDDDDRGSPEL